MTKETAFVLEDAETTDPTDFELVDDERSDVDLLPVRDARDRFPGLVRYDGGGETGFRIVDTETSTDFVLVGDSAPVADVPTRLESALPVPFEASERSLALSSSVTR